MTIVIDRVELQASGDEDFSPSLFQVWIDLNFGENESDWWWNSEPKPLAAALDECAEARLDGWICQMLPEGINARPDGRWDNP